jgi:8-oxo-dGTP pyrophosphatase MutT (NUDIX family)
MNVALSAAWLESLAQRLTQPLPGRAGQRRFEPDLGFGRHFGPAPPDARPAAVMILLYPGEDGVWRVPLTVRPAEMTAHAGQISLPGGSIDPHETDEAAALRELFEELAVVPQDVTPLGRLTPLYIFGTNFLVLPWLAMCHRRPAFVANAAEVAELLEPSLAELCAPTAWGRHQREVRGIRAEVPHIQFGQHRVWGATAMILGELMTLVEQAESVPQGLKI